jgi:murein DD-endopeptidase
MNKKFLCAILSGLLMIAVQAAAEEGPPKDDPLYMRLGARPAPQEAALLEGKGHKYSAYEVYLTNFGATDIKIVEVNISGKDHDKNVLSRKYTGKELASAFQAPASVPEPTLRPSESGVLFLLPELSSAEGLPTSFETAITIEGAGERSGSGTIKISSTPLNGRAPAVISPPVDGNNWLAVNGPSNTSSHRRAIILINGIPKIGQRYAIDWVQLGPDGKTFHGNEKDNASYYAYGHPIHAVADGKIVEVTDGIAENVPNTRKLGTQITYKTLAGNHVMEDLGDGHFATYAHLKPGTIKVKVGDQVHSGDVLASLGNSGNSSEPHLHFQLCDAAAVVDCEGLPFAINKFTHSDYVIAGQGGDKQTLTIKGSHPVTTAEEPMEDELDSFVTK